MITLEIKPLLATAIVAGFAIIQFLLAEWIKIRLLKSVEHAYQKKLEDYKSDIRLRENAARIAEALARYHYGDGKDQKGFIQLIWELSIYLPEDIVKDLSIHLVEHQKKNTDPKDLLVKVRKLFHGKNDSIIPENLIHLELKSN